MGNKKVNKKSEQIINSQESDNQDKKVSNSQPHDRFFKNSMSYPEVAKEFFESYLPDIVKSKVNLDTLKSQKTDFIDNTLKAGVVDMLFSVEFGKDLGYFYLLVEHQSKADLLMPFRICNYMFQIWDHHRKKYPKKKKLPLIYPMIFYDGKAKYNAPLDLWGLFDDPKLAKSFFVEPFQLIDLQKIEDAELLKMVWVGIMQYIMKWRDEPDILPFLQPIVPLIEKLSKKNLGYTNGVLWYIMETAESKTVKEVIEVFRNAQPEGKREGIMTIAERLLKENPDLAEKLLKENPSMAERIRKNDELKYKLEVVNNMLAMGQDIKVICQATGLTEEELKKLIHKNTN